MVHPGGMMQDPFGSCTKRSRTDKEIMGDNIKKKINEGIDFVLYKLNIIELSALDKDVNKEGLKKSVRKVIEDEIQNILVKKGLRKQLSEK